MVASSAEVKSETKDGEKNGWAQQVTYCTQPFARRGLT
jgi:hypothetical protein